MHSNTKHHSAIGPAEHLRVEKKAKNAVRIQMYYLQLQKESLVFSLLAILVWQILNLESEKRDTNCEGKLETEKISYVLPHSIHLLVHMIFLLSLSI